MKYWSIKKIATCAEHSGVPAGYIFRLSEIRTIAFPTDLNEVMKVADNMNASRLNAWKCGICKVEVVEVEN